jgi:hemoglobin
MTKRIDMKFSAGKYKNINKDNINQMVLAFYTKILSEDNDVAKVFVSQLGSDINSEAWREHIEILTNFWAMIALDDTQYDGNPLRPHLLLPLKREMFSSWLNIFFETIDSLYETRLGAVFKDRAEIIAGNFMRNMRL